MFRKINRPNRGTNRGKNKNHRKEKYPKIRFLFDKQRIKTNAAENQNENEKPASHTCNEMVVAEEIIVTYINTVQNQAGEGNQENYRSKDRGSPAPAQQFEQERQQITNGKRDNIYIIIKMFHGAPFDFSSINVIIMGSRFSPEKIAACLVLNYCRQYWKFEREAGDRNFIQSCWG